MEGESENGRDEPVTSGVLRERQGGQDDYGWLENLLDCERSHGSRVKSLCWEQDTLQVEKPEFAPCRRRSV